MTVVSFNGSSYVAKATINPVIRRPM